MIGYDTTQPTTATFCPNCGTVTGSTFFGQWIHYHPQIQYPSPPTFEAVIEVPASSKRRRSDVERWLRAMATDCVRAEKAIAKLRRHFEAVRESRLLQVASLPEVERRGRVGVGRTAWGFEHRQRCRTTRKPRPLVEKMGEKRCARST
jgi:hypothetical protein